MPKETSPAPLATSARPITTSHPRTTNLGAALFWMAVALCSFTMVAISGREAGRGTDTMHIMFYRSAIGLILVTLIASCSRRGLRQLLTRRVGLHGLRNSIHFIAQYSWLSALMLVPLAQLIAIEFTAPLWVALLAPLLLGERLTLTRAAAAVIGFVGIITIIRPGSVPVTTGTLFAMTAAIGFAGAMMTTKKLVATETVLGILFHMSWMQLLISGLALYPAVTIPDLQTAYWIGAVTLSGMMAHYALTSAFSHADAVTVAPMDFLRLPLITMVGFILYQEPLQETVLFGAGIVVAGNLINLFGERRQKSRA